MDKSKKIRFWVVGDGHRAEFETLRSQLANDPNVLPTYLQDQFELLQRCQAAIKDPDLLVILQSRRGQYSQQEINQIVNRFPLVQKVLVYGAWCEGETRSGRPVQGIHRVAVTRWQSVFSKICYEWFHKQGTTWLTRPTIETRADRLLAENSGPMKSVTDPAMHIAVSVYSCSRDFVESVQEFGQSLGWAIERFSFDNIPGIVVFDCQFSVAESIAFYKRPSPHQANSKMVIVCGFSRPQDRRILQETLTTEWRLLDKPFDVRDLRSAIQQLAGKPKKNSLNIVA